MPSSFLPQICAISLSMPYKTYFAVALLSTFAFAAGCSDDPLVPGSDAENYLPTSYNGGIGAGQAFMSVWVGNRIYSTWPIRFYELDEHLRLVQDSVPFAYTETNTFPSVPDSVLKGFFSISANPDGTKLLAVRCLEHGVSNGSLEEIDTRTWSTTEVLPASRNISRAVFKSPDSVIYYTNGSSIGASDAGYYVLVKSTGKASLLMPYYSHSGKRDIVNGFDYSKTRNSLIIPITRAGNPSIIELDLNSLQVDTLPLHINSGFERWHLFLRYSHDGSRALYSSYSSGNFRGPSFEPTEMGIIDLKAGYTVSQLHRPGISDSAAISLFPEWSPTETHIVFSASKMLSEPAGSSHALRPSILKLP